MCGELGRFTEPLSAENRVLSPDHFASPPGHQRMKRHHLPGYSVNQRGVTLMGLMLWAIIIGFAALLGMRVLPSMNEFFTIQKTVNKIAADGGS